MVTAIVFEFPVLSNTPLERAIPRGQKAQKWWQTLHMAELALVLLIGLLGPVLALPKRFAIPVAVGELLAGVAFGVSGFRLIDVSATNLQLLSSIGFALVMMVAASHIDVNRFANRAVFLMALRNVGLSAVVGLAVGLVIAYGTGAGSLWALFAVLVTSSSAAVVLPVFQNRDSTVGMESFLAQVALADLISVLMLPLVADPARIVQVSLGAAMLLAVSALIFFVLKGLGRSGKWKSLRHLSRERHFGLELRLSLILLLGLIWVAQSFTVTILIAGFGLGLAIGANGLPHRLARQLFAVSEGFFAPIFFVLLGASIDFREALTSPQLLGMAALLGAGAVVVHLIGVAFGQRLSLAVAASAQLGVPSAAVSIGVANGLLSPGQAGAVMLGALFTLLATAWASTRIQPV
jgi:Kef-type K+ transport system membrane component KefB